MAIMKNILAASVLGLACVVAATPGFAQENPGFTQRQIMRDPGLLGGATPPQIPTYQSRIPAPLPPPPQPPVINGPLSHTWQGALWFLAESGDSSGPEQTGGAYLRARAERPH